MKAVDQSTWRSSIMGERKVLKKNILSIHIIMSHVVTRTPVTATNRS